MINIDFFKNEYYQSFFSVSTLKCYDNDQENLSEIESCDSNTKYCQLKTKSGSGEINRDCLDSDAIQLFLNTTGYDVCYKCRESRGCSAVGEMKKDDFICYCRSNYCNQNCKFQNCSLSSVNDEHHQKCTASCTPGNTPSLPSENGT